MKHKHKHKLSVKVAAGDKRGIVTMLVVGLLIMQPILFVDTVYALTAPTKAQITGIVTNTATNAANSAVNSAVNSYVPASTNIAGKCVSQVLQQKVTAYAAGAVVAAIGFVGLGSSAVLGVPSSDLGSGKGSIMQSGEGGATTVMSWIKPMTDCLVHAASQLMIDNLNMAVNNAIRQGLNGSPNYSSNTSQFMSDLSAMIAGGLRNQISGLNLCDFTGNGSFKTNLSNSIGLSTPQAARQNFAKKIECPFPAGANAQNFYNDFGNGGWRGYQTTLSDSGNPFGTALIANQELDARQAETASLAEKQLQQGNGYYPVVNTAECNYPPDLEDYLYPDPNNKAALNGNVSPTELANVQRLYCKVTTPGKTVADTASKGATSAWDRLNVSGVLGKTMEGFSLNSVTDALGGTFSSSGATGMAGFTSEQQTAGGFYASPTAGAQNTFYTSPTSGAANQ